ncbi:MAG: glutaredoxin family protein [Pseudomonadota bacterium]|nr:MAG: glutaredoxin family protein [Pseudomonadota bacterium]
MLVSRQNKFLLLQLPLLLLYLAVGTEGVAGEIYKWTDAQGNVHFTDQPPEGAGASRVEVRVNTVSAPPLNVDKLFPDSEAPQRASRKKVVLYSAQWCGYCKKARQYLKQRKVRFTEYDVEKSKQGADEYRSLKGKGVPLIMVGKQRVNGFDQARLEQLLK